MVAFTIERHARRPGYYPPPSATTYTAAAAAVAVHPCSTFSQEIYIQNAQRTYNITSYHTPNSPIAHLMRDSLLSARQLQEARL